MYSIILAETISRVANFTRQPLLWLYVNSFMKLTMQQTTSENQLFASPNSKFQDGKDEYDKEMSLPLRNHILVYSCEV